MGFIVYRLSTSFIAYNAIVLLTFDGRTKSLETGSSSKHTAK
jgi:hypothetical protein